MSKKLQKRATRLVRKAENRALTIKRVVREYRYDTQKFDPAEAGHADRHREIERAVAKYNEANRALRRIGKKIQLKAKDTAGRAFGAR